MNAEGRPPRLLHCTSEPLHFFGRAAELALLDAALGEGGPSVVALVGPGGQGKTAIVRHWLERFGPSPPPPPSPTEGRGGSQTAKAAPPPPVSCSPPLPCVGEGGRGGVRGVFFW